MRKIYWFLWICCMAAIVSACSNDDDEPGMEIPGGDNGTIGTLPGGDDIWPENVRRVRRIAEIYEPGISEDFISFDYNGKVIRGYGSEDYSSPWGICLNLTVGTSAVEIYSIGHTGTASLELKDGKIIKGACSISAEYDYDSCYCMYENGYLKQLIDKEYGHGRVSNTQYDFTFNSGNLSSKKRRSENYNSWEEEILKYSYTENIRNDANIDLFVWVDKVIRGDRYNFMSSSGDFFYLGMFGFFGERNKTLPTKITYELSRGDTEESYGFSGSKTEEWNISYEVDKEGYPIRIKCKEKNSDEVVVLGIYY